MRYVMPILVLEAALAAASFARRLPRTVVVAAFAALIRAIPFVLFNQLRPLLRIWLAGQWLDGWGGRRAGVGQADRERIQGVRRDWSVVDLR